MSKLIGKKDNRIKTLVPVFALLIFCVVMLALIAFVPALFDSDDMGKDFPMYAVTSPGGLKIFPYCDDDTGDIYFFLPGKTKYKLVKKDDSFKGNIFFLNGGEVNTMYIVTGKDSMKDVDEDPHHKTEATADYSIYAPSGAKETSGKLKISGHGNSTWTELMEEFPGQEFKRSYNISFIEKKSILGMDRAGSYVLLSNFYDESGIKNYAALETARRLGMENVPDCEYVNLYINGEYRGLYLAAQKIKENNGFLDLSSDGYLAKFDYEERVKAEGNLYVETGDLFAKVLYPLGADGEKLAEITTDLRKVEDAVRSGEDDFAKVADEESFIKYYLLQEFFENGDADRASQYIYKKEKDGKIIAGPVWDFDLAMGHPWFSYDGDETNALWIKGLVEKNGWLRGLSDDDAFMEKTYKYYEDSFSGVVGDVICTVIPETTGRIGDSFHMDMIRYDKGPVYFDKFDYGKYGSEKYDNSVIAGSVSDWLIRRKEFWDDYAKDPDSYIEEVREPGKDTRSIRELIVMKKK